jgi:hypothetical protein
MNIVSFLPEHVDFVCLFELDCFGKFGMPTRYLRVLRPLI